MNLHEYQSKELFAQYSIPVPKGQVASSPEEAGAVAQRTGTIAYEVVCGVSGRVPYRCEEARKLATSATWMKVTSSGSSAE